MEEHPRIVRNTVKRGLDAGSLAATWPLAFACRLEERLKPGSEAGFRFWSQTLSLLPGRLGVFLRRGYYRWTLESSSPEFFVGFGALFTHRRARVGRRVYVGPYALVGAAALGDRCLIGSRASLLSGSELHGLDASGRWTPFHASRLQQISVGPDAWIGEGAVVMANIGAGAAVAAGSVVSAPVAPHIVVAGNPARFVRRLSPIGAEPAAAAAARR